MASQFTTDLTAMATRRRVLSLGGAGLGGIVLAAWGRAQAAGRESGATCIATPTEIRGPFPADGTGRRGRAINILDADGLMRRDIRASIAGLEGTARGVPLELELMVVDADGCTPVTGRAVYLWQCDARGDYSMYNRTDVNYLRGLQVADAQGRAQFTSIVPGCYGGRMPHVHLEVFDSADAATGGAEPLLVTQLAFPSAPCREVYADRATYGESIANLERWNGETDWMLRGEPPEVRAAQTIAMAGDPTQGYRGTAVIGI